MQDVRIGFVDYLNTRPLVEGLDGTKGLDLRRGVPSKQVGFLLSGEADLALVSMIDAAMSPEPLAVVPAGMIGCDGPTLTVRLYSQTPIESVREVHADTDSHTSVALCRLIIKERTGEDPRLVDYDARERMPLARAADGEDSAERDGSHEWPDAMLLIGDKVVTDSPPAVRYPHQLDLGEAWRELTGQPFVYATWMCRAERAGDGAIRSAGALLDRQRRRNETRIDAIVTRHAHAHRWPVDLARKYIGSHLRFDFGDRELAAAREFLKRCADAGLAPAVDFPVVRL